MNNETTANIKLAKTCGASIYNGLDDVAVIFTYAQLDAYTAQVAQIVQAHPEAVRGALLIKMLAGNESSDGVLVSLTREDQKAIRLAQAQLEKTQASI